MLRETLRGVRMLLAAFAVVLAGSGAIGAAPAAAADNGLALTPPMGWNSWNSFGQAIDESTIKSQVDALVASGLKDAGYDYVIVDGGWKLRDRDAQGNLQVDPEKFPHGMRALADYVHSKGLKLGLHQPAGMTDCAGNSPGTQSAPGDTYAEKARHDARQLAGWGIDYLKFDLCSFQYPAGADVDEQHAITVDAFHAMADALRETGRPILYSVSEYGRYQPWLWAPQFANMWRTTLDVAPFYGSVMGHVDQEAGLAQYAGPGHWNDPDMLEVGVTTRLQNAMPIFDGVRGLSEDEARTQFSMWSMLAAPLLAGTDLVRMSDESRRILENRRVIAVDQDPLGAQATKVRDYFSDASAGGGPSGGGAQPVPASFADEWDLRDHGGVQQVVGDGSGTPAVLGRSGAVEASDPTWAASPAADSEGRFPTVLSFDGRDDILNLPGVDDLDLSHGFTFETWVYQRSRTSFPRLFERAPGMQLFLNDAGQLQANVRAADGTLINPQSAESIPLDQWTHVGLRYDVSGGQARVRFFIDGREVTYANENELTTTTQLAGQGNRTWVGNRGQGDRPLDGMIAYARLIVPADALDGWRTGLFPFQLPADAGDLEVWTKPLADGDRAVTLLNRSSEPQQMTTTAAEIGMPAARMYLVRDLWGSQRERVGDGRISAQVPSHGVAMYRVSAAGAVAGRAP